MCKTKRNNYNNQIRNKLYIFNCKSVSITKYVTREIKKCFNKQFTASLKLFVKVACIIFDGRKGKNSNSVTSADFIILS